MDTTSTAGSAASVSFRVEPSVKLAGQPNVIQTYKGIVKGMVGLMLRLSHERLTPALTQELEGAACALVRLLVIACHCNPFYPSGSPVCSDCWLGQDLAINVEAEAGSSGVLEYKEYCQVCSTKVSLSLTANCRMTL